MQGSISCWKLNIVDWKSWQLLNYHTCQVVLQSPCHDTMLSDVLRDWHQTIPSEIQTLYVSASSHGSSTNHLCLNSCLSLSLFHRSLLLLQLLCHSCQRAKGDNFAHTLHQEDDALLKGHGFFSHSARSEGPLFKPQILVLLGESSKYPTSQDVTLSLTFTKACFLCNVSSKFINWVVDIIFSPSSRLC